MGHPGHRGRRLCVHAPGAYRARLHYAGEWRMLWLNSLPRRVRRREAIGLYKSSAAARLASTAPCQRRRRRRPPPLTLPHIPPTDPFPSHPHGCAGHAVSHGRIPDHAPEDGAVRLFKHRPHHSYRWAGAAAPSVAAAGFEFALSSPAGAWRGPTVESTSSLLPLNWLTAGCSHVCGGSGHHQHWWHGLACHKGGDWMILLHDCAQMYGPHAFAAMLLHDASASMLGMS